MQDFFLVVIGRIASTLKVGVVVPSRQPCIFRVVLFCTMSGTGSSVLDSDSVSERELAVSADVRCQ